MGSVWFSEETAVVPPNKISLLVFVMKTWYAFFNVGTELLSIVQMSFGFIGLSFSLFNRLVFHLMLRILANIWVKSFAINHIGQLELSFRSNYYFLHLIYRTSVTQVVVEGGGGHLTPYFLYYASKYTQFIK
jgi:hypothetical protein